MSSDGAPSSDLPRSRRQRRYKSRRLVFQVPRGSSKEPRKTRSPLWIFIIPAFIIGGELVLLSWRVSTYIRLDLVARRFVCHVSEAATGAMIDPGLKFRSLMIEDFSRLALSPGRVEIAPISDSSAAAWEKLGSLDSVIVESRNASSRAWLQGAGAELGALDVIRLAGSQLAVESRNEQLSIAVDSPQRLDLPIFADFQLAADFVDVAGLAHPAVMADHVKMRMSLPQDRLLRVESQTDGLTLTLGLPESGAKRLFVSPVAIGVLELADRDPSGAEISTLIEDARLRYPDHPEIPVRVIPANHILELRGLHRARLSAAEGAAKGLVLHLEGDAGEIVSRFSGRERHFELSASDDLARHLPGGRLERWALILTMTMSIYSFIVTLRSRRDRRTQKK